jgi:hypothetical protein
MSDQSRRAFIKGSGAAIASAVGLGAVQPAAAAENGWVDVETPISKSLNGVVNATGGPWAAGGGGKVLERTPGADWEVRLKSGPTGAGNGLTCIDATTDGEGVWVAGGSGVIGEIDTTTKRLTDYSAPGGKTSTWEAISVTGTANQNETISLVNGSGEELTGERQPDGSIAWDDVVKPGGGASMKGAGIYGENSFLCCDTNAKVYESTDSGTTWDDIGIAGGSVGLYDVAGPTSDDINVAGGGGAIFRYDGNRWTKLTPGSNTIKGIDRLSEEGLASGGSGYVFRRQTIGSWERRATPTGSNLLDAVIGEGVPDIAVGSSGTIVEKQLL